MPGFKNYGPNVSEQPQSTTTGGQFSSEDRAYESVIIQEDAPVIDWEMNLRTDVSSDQGLRLGTQRQIPSCFLTGDFLERSDILGSYVMIAPAGGDENVFNIRAQNLVANGWNIRFLFSGTSSAGMNRITLPIPPLAGTRTDFVFLEIWRALIRPTPSVANKSPTGLICRNGNVKAPDVVNLTDDLIDPVFAAESNIRVQIQYRYRVVSGIDVFAYPDGLDSPALTARTVSDFTGPGADGNATAYLYSSVDEDKSLWRAGTGDAISATALGTVDGFMYAIPICAVFRRNSGAFDRTLNMNGGALIAALTSDRPDGLFSDQIIAEDIKDMRKGCARDYGDVLQKVVQQLLDNALSTEAEISSQGTEGTAFLFRDDLGTATHPGNPDRVRRSFSDRNITENIVARVDTGGVPVAFVDFDLSNFRVAWEAAGFNTLAAAPVGTEFISALKIRFIDPVAMTDVDAIAAGLIASVTFLVNVGPGYDRARVTFTAPQSGKEVHAELAITYPGGNGLTRNVLIGRDVWAPSAAAIAPWVDGFLFTPTSDVNRFHLDPSLWTVDPGHREVFIKLHANPQTVVFFTDAIDHLFLWERLDGTSISITDGINAPYFTTNYTANTAYTQVILSGGVPVPAGTAVTVVYQSFRPLPEVAGPPADSYQVFYDTRAIQSLLPPAGTQTLKLIPRKVSDHLYIISRGSGSPDDATSPSIGDIVPYIQPGAQIPIGLLPSVLYPESILNSGSDVAVGNPSVEVAPFTFVPVPVYRSLNGFLKTSAQVNYEPNPAEVTLHRDAPDQVIDADGRRFWPKSDNGSIPVRRPYVSGIDSIDIRRRKIVLPVIMELKEDFPTIGKKGTTLLIIITRYADFDNLNNVVLLDSLNDSSAAVYRVRGNLMNPQRTDP